MDQATASLPIPLFWRLPFFSKTRSHPRASLTTQLRTPLVSTAVQVGGPCGPSLHIDWQCMSRSVVSDPLWPQELHSPWNSPGLGSVAIPFSRGSSQPRDRTQVSRTTGGFFTGWATREAPHINHVSANTFTTRFGKGPVASDLLLPISTIN